ncbi:LPS assembly lipoprotein LptE [Aliiroseovarius sp. KMU-50]|uniref:LPS assembly lipoprotein LptE n=1 Tax=Aliiroseovarius salicola TaxID=3009082 RepID=A0ABT4VYU8_9RHOB|nr:LPS assembly lipoprotein LptE [Aliiroseovarius sp. KMU-50]MDA5092905.1 LPS assembly lipoprotein LptE [Aliiroseovarius sp. KMU-50]
MWLSDRRSFLALLLAGGLSACGFTPVYAPGGSGEGLQGSVTIAEPDTREGFELVKALEARLGRNLSARYDLNYTITTRTQGLGVTAAQEITRTQVMGEVGYEVVERDTDQVVHKGTVSNFTSYSSEGSTVSTAAVERDAYRRLMVSMADLITTRLMATYSGWGS